MRAPVNQPAELGKALKTLRLRYPEYANFPIRPEEIQVFRVVPELISMLDSAKGFGHSELVTL